MLVFMLRLRTNIERFLTDRMKTRLKAEMADSKTR